MKRYLLLGAVLCSSVLVFAQKAVNFKLNPEVGKTMVINMLMKTDIEGPQTMIMDMDMQLLVTPQKIEADNFVIQSVTKTIKVDIDAGLMSMSYNSTQEPSDDTGKMLAEQFGKIIGTPIITTVSPKGKLIDIVVPENLKGGMDASSFSNITTPLPETAVNPGESWNSTTTVENNPVLAKTEMTSTYKEETADGYVIDIVAKLFDSTEKEIGNMTGTYILNKKTFFTKSGLVKSVINVQGTKIKSDVTMQVD